MEQQSIEEELEQVFGKLKQLKVGNSRSRRRRHPRRSSRQNKEQYNTDEDIKQKDTIHQTIKSPERKSVIRESRLKLPKGPSTSNTKDEKCVLCQGQEFESKKELDSSDDKPQAIKRSCSTEFRNAELLMQGCKQENFDNTSPSELAGYLEQILHFPKPMSAMAEMMYG